MKNKKKRQPLLIAKRFDGKGKDFKIEPEPNQVIIQNDETGKPTMIIHAANPNPGIVDICKTFQEDMQKAFKEADLNAEVILSVAKKKK